MEVIGCISLIGVSSKPEDVAGHVMTTYCEYRCVYSLMNSSFCIFIIGVDACFQVFGSAWLLGVPGLSRSVGWVEMLTPEVCRLLSHNYLPKLCQTACECGASLAQDSVLQLQLLQAGALWHLLILWLWFNIGWGLSLAFRNFQQARGKTFWDLDFCFFSNLYSHLAFIRWQRHWPNQLCTLVLDGRLSERDRSFTSQHRSTGSSRCYVDTLPGWSIGRLVCRRVP